MDVKEIRSKLNLTQAELAEKLGVHRITVLHWESGSHKPDKRAQRDLKLLLEKSIQLGTNGTKET
jgi:DNA-binding transcriptional regulator YiaG